MLHTVVILSGSEGSKAFTRLFASAQSDNIEGFPNYAKLSIKYMRAQELPSSFDRHFPILRQVKVVDPHYDESMHHWLNDSHD